MIFKLLMGLGLLLMFTFLATAHVWMVPKNTIRRGHDESDNKEERPDPDVNPEDKSLE